MQSLVATAEKRIDEAERAGRITEEQATELKAGLEERIEQARRRRLPTSCVRTPSRARARLRHAAGATTARRGDDVVIHRRGQALPGPDAVLVHRVTRSRGGSLVRVGYLIRGLASPECATTRRGGERGREPRARLTTSARHDLDPHRVEVPPLPQVLRDVRVLDRHGAHSSPPVSQPMRTNVAISEATRSRNALDADPSTQSSPTVVAPKTMGV